MTIAELEVAINADVSGLDRDISGAVGRAKDAAAAGARSISQSMRQMGSVMRGAGVAMTAGVTLPMVAFAGGAVLAATKLDAMKHSLTSLMGSSAAAQVELAKLQEVAKLPGINLTGAVEGAVRLASVGIEADKARKLMIELANANALAAGSADNLQGAMYQLTQVISSGVLQGDELRIISERIPMFRIALADAFGTANSEVIGKMMKSGQLSMEAFIDGVISGLEGMERATESMQTKIDNFKDRMILGFAEIGESLFPILEQAMEALGKFADKALVFWDALGPGSQRALLALAGIVVAAGPALVVLGSLLTAIASVSTAVAAAGGLSAVLAGLGATLSALAIPIGLVVAGVVLLAAAWATNAGDIRGETQKMASTTRESFGQMKQDIDAFSAEFAVEIGGLKKYITDQWHNLWSVVVGVLSTAWDAVLTITRLALDTVMTFFRIWKATFSGDWRELGKVLADFWSRTWNRIQALFAGVAENMLRALRFLVQSAGNLLEMFGVEDVGTEGLDRAIEGLDKMGAQFRGLTGDIGGATSALGDYDKMMQMALREAAGDPLKYTVGRAQSDLDAVLAQLQNQAVGGGAAAVPFKVTPASLVPVAPAIDLPAMDAAKKLADEIAAAQDRYKTTMVGLRKELAMVGNESRAYGLVLDFQTEQYKHLTLWQKLAMLQLTKEIELKQKAKVASDALAAAVAGEWNALKQMLEGLDQEQALRGVTSRVGRLQVEMEKFKHVGGYFGAALRGLIMFKAEQLDAQDAADAYAAKMTKIWDDIKAAIIEAKEKATDRFAESMQELNVRAIEASGGAALLQHEMDELAKSFGFGALGLLRAEQYMDRLLDVQKLERWRSALDRVRDTIMESFTRMFEDLFENGFANFFDNVIAGFRNMLVQIAQEYLSSQIRGLLGRLLSGGGGSGGSGFANAVGMIGMFAGRGSSGGSGFANAVGMIGMFAGRAVGGPVAPNTPYVVGEHGAEIFMPQGAGRMRPESQLGGPSIVINMTIHTPDAQSFRRSKDQIIGEMGRAVAAHRLRTA